MDQKSQNRAKILVVDDEQIIRHLLSIILQDAGYEVFTCNGGREAIEFADRNELDIVVTDLKMPDVDGFQVLRAIQERQPDTPVLILTGDEKVDNAVKAIQLGAYDFLTKRSANKSSLFLVSIERALEKRELMKARREHQLRIETQNRALMDGLKAAKHIQKTMMNRDFSRFSPDLDVAYRYLPIDQVGGDFFDVVRYNKGHILFYIADVAGQGVSAAMVSVYAKQTISKMITTSIMDNPNEPIGPVRLLREVNREVLAQRFEIEELPLYLTIFIGLVDLENHSIIFSNGGHIPMAVMIRSDGRTENVPINGSPIGLIDNPNFDEIKIDYDVGDSLIMCTDGLMQSESGEDGALFYPWLAEIISRNGGRKGEELVDMIMKEAEIKRNGQSSRDDESILLLSMAK